MSKFANKYNKGSKFTFKAGKDFEFHKLSELFKENGEEQVYIIRAMYISKSKKKKYPDAPVFILDDCFANVPSHQTETVKAMLEDEELIDAINNGEFGFTIDTYEYEDEDGDMVTGYSPRYIDI